MGYPQTLPQSELVPPLIFFITFFFLSNGQSNGGMNSNRGKVRGQPINLEGAQFEQFGFYYVGPMVEFYSINTGFLQVEALEDPSCLCGFLQNQH